MDQSKSNNADEKAATQIALPQRNLSLEFWVGVFLLVAVACGAYLAIGLGDMKLFTSNRYELIAVFDNISGLKSGASVEIAGVPIGEVTSIDLHDPNAYVTLSINKAVQIKDDDIAVIRTKGIIGDRYVKISRGASDHYLPAGSKMTETESVVDFEDIIGKIVHNLGGDKDKDSDKK